MEKIKIAPKEFLEHLKDIYLKGLIKSLPLNPGGEILAVDNKHMPNVCVHTFVSGFPECVFQSAFPDLDKLLNFFELAQGLDEITIQFPDGSKAKSRVNGVAFTFDLVDNNTPQNYYVDEQRDSIPNHSGNKATLPGEKVAQLVNLHSRFKNPLTTILPSESGNLVEVQGGTVLDKTQWNFPIQKGKGRPVSFERGVSVLSQYLIPILERAARFEEVTISTGESEALISDANEQTLWLIAKDDVFMETLKAMEE
jgi:hypothetical protein